MDGLHIVVAKPPAGVSDEDFNQWYDAHLDEILSVEGFRSAQRFQLEPVVGDDALPHRFICVYEIDGDPRDAVAELERAGNGLARFLQRPQGRRRGDAAAAGMVGSGRVRFVELPAIGGGRRGPRA